MTNKLLAAIVAMTVLAGCRRAEPEPEPVSTPAATPIAAPTPASSPVSIIREDIEAKPEPPQLTPLHVVIGFPEGGNTLDSAAVAKLQSIIESPQMIGGGAITLRGHTDSTGADRANLGASRKRAEAVRQWLVSHGIAEGRIAVIAMGEQNPVRPNALPDGTPDEAGRAANRRVELSIAVPASAPVAAASAPAGTSTDQVAR